MRFQVFGEVISCLRMPLIKNRIALAFHWLESLFEKSVTEVQMGKLSMGRHMFGFWKGAKNL